LFLDQSTSGLVVGDSHRLGQVLGNIIGNAVKFTDEGEILVEAACERGDNGRVFVRFKVADTGLGISPEAVPLLFERFSQERTGTARTHGGSGLGLAICKLLIELMGGTIRVESVQGKGSVFSFDVILTTADRKVLQD
jgi:signal transduction histidine kinase